MNDKKPSHNISVVITGAMLELVILTCIGVSIATAITVFFLGGVR